VTSTCSGSTKKNEPHEVHLSAHLTSDGSSRLTVGGATLEVVKAKGPGNDVTILSWSLTAPPADMVAPTTTPTSTSTTVPATTSTSTPTTTSTTPTGVSWSSRVTSEWETGYCVEVTVTNNKKNTEKWTVQVPVKGTIYVFWSAKYSRAGDTLTVSGESWNRSLKSGESTAFGWCSNF
jgi:septal ring-binding cell division protein DamX